MQAITRNNPKLYSLIKHLTFPAPLSEPIPLIVRRGPRGPYKKCLPKVVEITADMARASETAVPPVDIVEPQGAETSPLLEDSVDTRRKRRVWSDEEESLLAQRSATLRQEKITPSLTELVNEAINDVLPVERRRKLNSVMNAPKLLRKIEMIFAEKVTAPIERVVEKPIYVRCVDDEIRASVDDLWRMQSEIRTMLKEVHNKVHFAPANGSVSDRVPVPAIRPTGNPMEIDLKIGVYGLMSQQQQAVREKLELRNIYIRDLYFYASDSDKTMKPPKPDSFKVFVCTKFINHPQVYQIERQLADRKALGYINGGVESTVDAIVEAVQRFQARNNLSSLTSNGSGNGNGHH